MFPHYHQMTALVAERHDRLEDGARRRRLLRGRRTSDAEATHRHDRPTTAVDAIPAAARQALPLERTPGGIHRAA